MILRFAKVRFKKGILFFIILAFCSFKKVDIEYVVNQEYVVAKVNRLRATGCYCGKKYMKPTHPIKWDQLLYRSALSHAKDMSRFHYFSHFSKEGKDIGERLDLYGYKWQVAGENLGEGQKNFEEVLHDWIDSKSHCKMLMNPKVEDMAVARFGKYWVQHFGKKLPPGAKVTAEK